MAKRGAKTKAAAAKVKLQYQDQAAAAVVYEFNAFSELILFSICEVKVKYRDILIKRRDDLI